MSLKETPSALPESSTKLDLESLHSRLLAAAEKAAEEKDRIRYSAIAERVKLQFDAAKSATTNEVRGSAEGLKDSLDTFIA